VAFTNADFRILYPEMARLPNGQVDAFIALAALDVDPAIWGAETDHGIGLRAAHYAALAPQGQQARLASVKGQTTYGIQFEALRDKVAAGDRVF
jgi:hypothetical protein